MKAKQVPIRPNTGKEYMSGFHFFKTKAAAKRLLSVCFLPIPSKIIEYKLIQCIVKKSWITQIGYELGYNKELQYQKGKEEIIIVAKKAIFP
jgi:hypothetical protein